MSHRTRAGRLLAVLAMIVLAAACRGKTPMSPSQDGMPVSLRIVGPSVVSLGDQVQLRAIVQFASGAEVEVTDLATWISSNASTLKVMSPGLLQALAAGQSGVTATFNSVTGDKNIAINGGSGSGGSDSNTGDGGGDNGGGDNPQNPNDTPQDPNDGPDNPGPGPGPGPGPDPDPGSPTVVGLTISGNTNVPVGGTSQLTAVAQMSDGTTQDVTALATWSSDNPAVATVDGGLLAGQGEGTTGIHASYGGHTANQVAIISAGGQPSKDLIGLQLDVETSLSFLDILSLNGGSLTFAGTSGASGASLHASHPILELTLWGLYSDNSKEDVTSACILANCITSPTGLLEIDTFGVTELLLLLVKGLLNPHHQINAVYGGYTANANITITDIPIVEEIQLVGNNGMLLGLGSQLPAVTAFLSGNQDLKVNLPADFPGLTYLLQPGSAVCEGNVVVCAIVKPLLDQLGGTLNIVNGTLNGSLELVNLILQAVGGLAGINLYLPVDVTATLNGVVQDTLQIRIDPR